MSDLQALASQVKSAAKVLALTEATQKNNALHAIAKALRAGCTQILAANEADLENARQNGMSSAMLDRLKLNEARVDSMADGVEALCELPDPVGIELASFSRPNGLLIRKVSVPLGVVGIIYEARPNVTADAAAICLKSGNAVLLRGGKEAIHSNTAIVECMQKAIKTEGLPADCIGLVTDTTRASSEAMMRLNGYLDVLIPRGGAGLIRAVVQNATVPVIETGTGNCHIYVDKTADIDMAASITYNAKVSRPSVCNAAETLLVHSGIAERALPVIAKKLISGGVTLHTCARAQAILAGVCDTIPATESDWQTEYLDYEMAVKIVDSFAEAVAHIGQYGTSHSECIVTSDPARGARFQREVDAAAVYVNASTRFTDGGQFGFGAEIGISTQKLHARGPMGLRELTSYRYLIDGNGQIRE